MSLVNDRKDILFIGIIVLMHVVFFLLALHYLRIYMGDSQEYIYEAVNIRQFHFFYSGNPAMPIDPEYMTQRQPLYPLLLALVYSLGGSNWMVLVLQNALSVFNILYTRNVLMSLGYSKKYDLVLMAFIAAYPSQFINSNTIDPDILLQTFTVLYFGSFIKMWRQPGTRNVILMSVWLVAGLFVKPVLYPFVLVHIVIVLLMAGSKKLPLQRPAVAAMLPLCAVLLYSYWNYNRTGKFHFSSNQAFNAIYYFDAYYTATEGPDSAAKFLATERKDMNVLPEYSGRYDYATARGMQLLKEHFGPYMFFHLKNAGRIFVDPGKAEMDLFTGRLTYGKLYTDKSGGFFNILRTRGTSGLRDYLGSNQSLPFVFIVIAFNVIRFAGLILFFTRKEISPGIRAFVFVLVCYFAIAAGPIANTRYFLPVSLMAIGCAVMGLSLKKQQKQLSRA